MTTTIARETIPEWALPSRILDPKTLPEADWAVALAAGDEALAASRYVAWLRGCETFMDLDMGYIHVAERFTGNDFGRHGGHSYDPEQVIRKHYVGVYGIEHTFTGEIDWMVDPTADWGDKQTHEWQVQFNRHYQWVPLARAWQATGKAEYARHWEYELLSWVGSQCPAPPRKDMRLPGTWRTIDAGIRGGWTWPLALEIFRRSAEVSDRALWLAVAAYREHGHYLFYSPTGCNFKAMENLALIHAGLLLPGLRDASVYASTALDRTMAELERQFFDDGLQVELAPSYGILSAACSYVALMLARAKGLAGPRETRIPPRVWQRLVDVMAVYGRVAMPDGSIPSLHDDNSMNAAAIYREARLVPMAGAVLPAELPWQQTDTTTHMEWGGYGILRREGRWAMLDGGPWGAAHQHADAMQVLTWSDGGPWLTDSGKPLYDSSPLTRHIRGAAAHNVVLLGGRPHLPVPQEAHIDRAYPMAVLQDGTLSLSAARRWAKTDAGALFSHERLLLDIAGVGWLVVDRLRTAADAAAGWEWLWHFDREVTLAVADGQAVATRTDGAARHIRVSASTGLALASVGGQEEPLRGWMIWGTGREPTPMPVLQARGGEGQAEIRCATLFAAEAVDLTWLAADSLSVGGATYHLHGDDEYTALEHPGGRLVIPAHTRSAEV